MNTERPDISPEVKEVYEYLKDLVATRNCWKFNHNTLSKLVNLKDRLSEGYTVEECKRIVDYYIGLWMNDPIKRQLLKPHHIFARAKFRRAIDEGIIQERNRPIAYYRGLKS